MATESSEGNMTTFRALVRHLIEANRAAEGDADSVISQYSVQEIPGGGSCYSTSGVSRASANGTES